MTKFCPSMVNDFRFGYVYELPDLKSWDGVKATIEIEKEPPREARGRVKCWNQDYFDYLVIKFYPSKPASDSRFMHVYELHDLESWHGVKVTIEEEQEWPIDTPTARCMVWYRHWNWCMANTFKMHEIAKSLQPQANIWILATFGTLISVPARHARSQSENNQSNWLGAGVEENSLRSNSTVVLLSTDSVKSCRLSSESEEIRMWRRASHSLKNSHTPSY